jgi:aerobic carbon-monoxide dehydrogenase medium subunit
VKAPAVRYERPATLEQAIASLSKHGDGAQLLAGGQSLVAMLNLRLAQPDVLIDISRLPGLAGIAVDGATLRIGALTTHRQIEDSPLVARHAPVLAEAVRHVAHPAIRNAGTIGGSVALSDPAAEYPACCLALDATIVAASAGGQRRIAAGDFFQGLYQTALQPGEIVVAVEVPVASAEAVHRFSELARRSGDYALVGLAACARRTVSGGGVRLSNVRLGFLGAGTRPLLATRAAALIEAGPLDADRIAQAQACIAGELDPLDDLNASRKMKLHLAAVLTGRVLSSMARD